MKFCLYPLLLAACLCTCEYGMDSTDPCYSLKNCSRAENRDIVKSIARLQQEARYLIVTQDGKKQPLTVLERTEEWDTLFAQWAQVKEWQENKLTAGTLNASPAPPEITITLSFTGADTSAPALMTFSKTPYQNEDFSPIAKGGQSMYDDLQHGLKDFPLSHAKYFYPYEKARQGNAEYQVLAAIRCFDGRQVLRPNLKEGYDWLDKAIAQHYHGAYQLYATIYAEGRYGQLIDKQRAINYYNKAIETLPPDEPYLKKSLEQEIQKLKS